MSETPVGITGRYPPCDRLWFGSFSGAKPGEAAPTRVTPSVKEGPAARREQETEESDYSETMSQHATEHLCERTQKAEEREHGCENVYSRECHLWFVYVEVKCLGQKYLLALARSN